MQLWLVVHAAVILANLCNPMIERRDGILSYSLPN